MKNVLTWLPRILVIASAVFVSVFALDAFDGNESLLRQTGHFLMHLIPSAVTLAFLFVAWRYRMLGGLLFMVWGLIFTIYFGTHHTLPLFLMFSLPLLVAGLLFMVSTLSVPQNKI
ncbi:MAG TPA: hypothetical protein PK228_06295 [Saprospiraceae bacterium]|nr:hypothetical protein [Saprospiraceae bacterium]